MQESKRFALNLCKHLENWRFNFETKVGVHLTNGERGEILIIKGNDPEVRSPFWLIVGLLPCKEGSGKWWEYPCRFSINESAQEIAEILEEEYLPDYLTALDQVLTGSYNFGEVLA